MRHFLFSLILTAAISAYANNTTAQTFLNKAEAIISLSDEAKYSSVLLDQLQDSNEIAMHRNRLRVITALLNDLKYHDSVEDAVRRCVPSSNLRQLQPGVGQFTPPTTDYPNHIAWLQADILKLVSN